MLHFARIAHRCSCDSSQHVLPFLTPIRRQKRSAIRSLQHRNLNYWDSVSTLAWEVSHPRKTFPRALLIAVGLVVVMYLGPLMIGLGVTVQADEWELGYFTKVASLVRCLSLCASALWYS